MKTEALPRGILPVLFAFVMALLSGPAHGTTLGIDGCRLTIDGTPTFLLGISYYGGLSALEDSLRLDLDDAQRYGFNWLRVWVTWEICGRDDSAVDDTGGPRQLNMNRLKRLVAECDRRGLVLDLTLARGTSPTGTPTAGRLPNLDAHCRAVKTLVTELKQWRNWYLDLANEHDVRDSRHVSMQEIRALRGLARELDRDRLITASFGGHDLDEQDLRDGLFTGELDIITPHRPRHAASPGQTEAATRRTLESMKKLGHVAPVLYQEPFRRGYTKWEPLVSDYLTDLCGAISAGAAGWCFHNGSQLDAPERQPRRCFDLSTQRLFDQLDAEERKILDRLKDEHFLGGSPADHSKLHPSKENDKVSVLRKGSQAGHYFQWRGKPLMLVGDSVTQGWMECGTNFDQDAYIDALAERGMTLAMLWAFKGTNADMQRKDKRIGYDAPELWPWQGSPDEASFDLRQFNLKYFTRLRSFVARAESKGIMVLITVHDGWTKTSFEGHPFNRKLGNGPLDDRRQYVELSEYTREMPEEFNPSWTRQQQNQYFQERLCAALIQELAPYSNVIYEMFNEGEWYDQDLRRLHEQHFLAFFRARCANLLLSNCDHLARFQAHDEDRLDVVTLHPNGWTGHVSTFVAGFRKLPPKPYLCSEPVPEFDGREPPLETIQRSAWETVLAGAGWVNQNDLSFGWDAHSAMSRKTATRDAAYQIAGRCARFFSQSGVNFSMLAPAPQLASTGCCLARSSGEFVVYAPAKNKFTMDLSAAAGKSFRTRWYDPSSGKFFDATPVAGGGRQTRFVAPFRGDSVVHLLDATLPQPPSSTW